MKICFAFLSVGKDIFAGIENSIYNLARGFQMQGVEVVLYSSYLSGSEGQIDSLPVVRSEILPRTLPQGDLTIQQCLTARNSEIQEEFTTIIQQEHVDYAITFDALWGILQVAGISANPPCPCIMSFHVPNTLELLRQAAQAPYLFRRTVSPILKQQIEQILPLKNLLVIPNSFDYTTFRPNNNAGSTSKIIFCNARIDVGKGIPDLIAAYAQFQQKYAGYELWLCGGDFPFGNRGQALQEVLYAIEHYHISSSVRLLPNLPWSRVPDTIRHSFAVVLPTYYESFGRAALECLGCAVPLIAARTGNIPYLAKDAAILVEPGSATAIYEALCTLVEQPDVYHQLTVQGPHIAAQYDNPIIAQQFLQAIQHFSANGAF